MLNLISILLPWVHTPGKKSNEVWKLIKLFYICDKNICMEQNEIAIIQNKILVIRNQQVMIDRDIAELYGVETRVLNQAVKRNIKRFPDDFMFVLNKDEKNELVTNCDRFKTLKHSTVMPFAFTEQGVAML